VAAAHLGVKEDMMVVVDVMKAAVVLFRDEVSRPRDQSAKFVKRSAIASIDVGRDLIVSSSWRRNLLIVP
jgi:hypothetical protein